LQHVIAVTNTAFRTLAHKSNRKKFWLDSIAFCKSNAKKPKQLRKIWSFAVAARKHGSVDDESHALACRSRKTYAVHLLRNCSGLRSVKLHKSIN